MIFQGEKPFTMQSISIRAICLVVTSSLISLLLSPATASEELTTRKIKTNGTAVLYVQPNVFTVIVGVETVDKDLKKAYQFHEQTSAKVLKLTEKYDIKPGDAQTTQMSVSPIYETESQKKSSLKLIKGYNISNSISFTFDNPKTIAPLLQDAIESGANTISSVTFNTTDQRKYRDETRIKALHAAREKAELLAKEENSVVGQAIEITESYSFSDGLANNNIGIEQLQSMQNDYLGGIAVGRIPVRASVSVIYELR